MGTGAEISVENNPYDSDHKAMNYNIQRTNKAGWEYRLEHDVEGRLDKPQRVQDFGGTGNISDPNQRAVSSDAIVQTTEPSRKMVKHDDLESSISEDSKEYQDESRSDEVVHEGSTVKRKARKSTGKRASPQDEDKPQQFLPQESNHSHFLPQDAVNPAGPRAGQQDSSPTTAPDASGNNFLPQVHVSQNFQASSPPPYVVPVSSVNNSSRVGAEMAYYGGVGDGPRHGETVQTSDALGGNEQAYYKRGRQQRSKDASPERHKRKKKKSKRRKSPLGKDPNRYLSQSPSEQVPIKQKVRSARKTKQL